MSDRDDQPHGREQRPDTWRPQDRPWPSTMPAAMRRGAELRRSDNGKDET